MQGNPTHFNKCSCWQRYALEHFQIGLLKTSFISFHVLHKNSNFCNIFKHSACSTDYRSNIFQSLSCLRANSTRDYLISYWIVPRLPRNMHNGIGPTINYTPLAIIPRWRRQSSIYYIVKHFIRPFSLYLKIYIINHNYLSLKNLQRLSNLTNNKTNFFIFKLSVQCNSNTAFLLF